MEWLPVFILDSVSLSGKIKILVQLIDGMLDLEMDLLVNTI